MTELTNQQKEFKQNKMKIKEITSIIKIKKQINKFKFNKLLVIKNLLKKLTSNKLKNNQKSNQKLIKVKILKLFKKLLSKDHYLFLNLLLYF
jgi:hypothetical protein